MTCGTAAWPLERKSAGLLAWLALRGPTPRHHLAALLWPSAAPEAGRNSLRQLLFKLRKAIGPELFIDGEPLALAPGVRLHDDHDPPLLDGHDFTDCPDFDAWLTPWRERWAAEGLARSLAACDAAEAAGDLPRAADLARALVDRDPLGEAAQQRWLRALYLRGDRAAALAAAQAFERRLADELGVAPSPALRRLIDSLKAPPAAESAPLDPPVPLTVLRPPRLVGRRTTLQAVAQARAQGTVPLLVGEPGQGKSRLVGELLGAGELAVAGRPTDAGAPYASLARVLRAVAGQWPEALLHPEAPALRPLLPDQIAAAPGGRRASASPLKAAEWTLSIAAQQGLRGLWLDDLHFFDAASLEALAVLIDAAPLAALRFGLARRPGEGEAALAALVDGLIDGDRLTELPLPPLDEPEVAELVDSLALPGVDAAALAPALRRATGGNPLFVLETLKAALLDARERPGRGLDPSRLPRPGSVMALIQRRLSRLSPLALNLARVAALAGPDFDAELAVAVLERPTLELTDAWAELEAAQILRDQAFAHDLVFEGTLAGVPQPIRRATRRTIAGLLEQRGGDPARIAAHWLAAGEPARAAPAFRAAARRAESALRYAEARDAMSQAAQCYDAAGRRAEALQCRVALANLWTESGERAQALALLQSLADAGETADERAQVACETVQCLSWMGRAAEATQWGMKCLDDPDLAEREATAAVARLRRAMADAFNSGGHPAQALAQLQAAGAYYDTATDPQERGWYHSDMGNALRHLGHYAASRAQLAQSLALARQTGRLRMVAGVLQVMAGVDHESGQLLPALERAEEALRLMTEVDQDTPFSWVLEVVIARERLQLGQLASACERLDALLGRAVEAPGHWRALLHAWRLRAWHWAGQPERAADSAEALAGAPSSPTLDGVRAMLALDLQALRAAGVLAPPAGTEIPEGTALHAAHGRRLAAARASCHPACPADLADWQATAQQHADAGLRLLADLAECRAAAHADDAASVARAGDSALAALRRVTVPGLYRPTLWLWLADALKASDPARARRALRDGADWVHTIAQRHLPRDAQAAFLGGNPVNRRLLAEWARVAA